MPTAQRPVRDPATQAPLRSPELIAPRPEPLLAGCHKGEIEHSAGEVQGIADHVGARDAALAGPSTRKQWQ
jgi:hypothetical protein